MPSTHLVLGAAGGIGSALCRRLAANGDQLVLAGRTEGPLRQLAEELHGLAVLTDATSVPSVQAAVDAGMERFGNLSGVVCCVGSILLKPAHRTSPEEWSAVLRANLDSAFAAVSVGAGALSRQGGSIVLLSSAAAQVGLPNHDAIAAAKAGVEGLARSAAATYARRGVRVNAVAPGLVRTPLSAHLTANAASEKASVGMHPLGRLGEPEDVARAIAWLLDPEQSWVTGQAIGVDGGLGRLR